MWQKRQVKLLRDEIEIALASLSEVSSLHNLVRQPLSRARRGLAAPSVENQPWPLLPLIVCEAICGYYEDALPAAAAMQLFMAAGDVFDDIEDADSSESLSAKYGFAVATNVATTLLILAEKALTRLREIGVADSVIVRIMASVNSFYTTACAGQHLDLSLAPDMAISEETYLRVTHMKSASQVECACHIGALLATTNQELIDKFAIFGQNLGMAAQITNDIQGITCGSDIVKRNITLPVVYALTQSGGEARDQLKRTFRRQAESVPDTAQIRDLLFRIGAIHYATVKMELYKQRALDILSEAERVGVNVERLKLLLE
jgi:geranylgeranyl diphosphate synthase type I